MDFDRDPEFQKMISDAEELLRAENADESSASEQDLSALSAPAPTESEVRKEEASEKTLPIIPPAPEGFDPQIGDEVLIRSLRIIARLDDIDRSRSCRLSVKNGMEYRADFSDLTVVPEKWQPTSISPPSREKFWKDSPRLGGTHEIDLHRMNQSEAEIALHQAITLMMYGDHETLIVIHGIGSAVETANGEVIVTGILKKRVQEFFQQEWLRDIVKEFYVNPKNQGETHVHFY